MSLFTKKDILFGIPLIGGPTAILATFVWTKHSRVESLDPEQEPLYKSPFYHKYNPYNNYSNADVVTRRIPLAHLKPELFEDARDGGSKLVEHFCGAIWSSFAYTPQRLIHARNAPPSSLPPPPAEDSATSPILSELSNTNNTVATTTKSMWSRLTSPFSSSSSSSPAAETPAATTPTSPPEDLWTRSELASSTYPPGSVITNHFLVLSKTRDTILVRCGDSPLTSPHGPRDSDGLFEISAKPNFERGYAEFQLKSVFYNGSEANRGATGGMGPWMWWLHQCYAKLWMEAAVSQCRVNKFRSIPAQWRQWEEVKEERRLEAAGKPQQAGGEAKKE